MDEVGWSILLLCVLIPLSLFFGLNTLSLRSFSRLKLQEAFKKLNKEQQVDEFLNKAEELTLVCGLMRVISSTAIIFLLMFLMRQFHFLLIFILAVCIIELFTLLIPHAWAKHTAEAILSRTYPVLKLFAAIAKPALVFFHLHDEFVRRLAGVQEADPEQAQEERPPAALRPMPVPPGRGYTSSAARNSEH